jgi:hypothetical protein
MATHFTNSPIEHTNDATYRAWRDEFSDALDDIGLNNVYRNATWASDSRPGVNTIASTEVWAFSDPLQATAPVFVKFEYGTLNGATNPAIFATYGTGHDGSGTLTGLISDRVQCSPNTTPTTGTNFPTRACFIDGQFWISFKGGASSSAASGGGLAFTGVLRSVNSSGAPSADGIQCYWRGQSTAAGTCLQAQSISFIYNSVGTITPNTLANYRAGAYSLNIMGKTSSNVGPVPQVFKHYGSFTRDQPLIGLISYIGSEIAGGAQYGPFPQTLVGGVQRQYFALGPAAVANTCAGTASNGQTSLAGIWE